MTTETGAPGITKHFERFDAIIDMKVEVKDGAPSNWLTRCFTDDWKRSFYDFEDVAEAYEHLAFNAVRNNMTDISELDGWADIDPGLVTFDVAVEVTAV